MGFYDVLHYNLHYIIGFVIVMVVFAKLFVRTKKGHYIFSRLSLSLPMFGNILSQAFVATFCRTTSTLLSSGVSVLEAFTAGFFPNMVIKMIQVGEESGSMPEVLEKTSEHYERKIDATVTMLLSLLEPIMIISVGAIVSVVVIALYLPIFTMSDM